MAATAVPRSDSEAGSPPLLIAVSEAARRLGLGRTTVYAEIAAGRLRTVKAGRRRLVPVAALDEYVALLDSEAGQ